MKKYLLLLSCMIVSESYLFTSSYKQTALKGVSAMLKPLDLLKQGDVPRVDIEKVAKSALSTAGKINANVSIRDARVFRGEDIKLDLLEEAIKSSDFNVANHIITTYGARNMLRDAIQNNMFSSVKYIVTYYIPDLKKGSRLYWIWVWTRYGETVPSYDIVKCLIEHNIEVNCSLWNSTGGPTPLLLAVRDFYGHERLNIVKALVERGANVNARDGHGRGVVEYIREGDIIHANRRRRLDYMVKTTGADLIDYLVENGLVLRKYSSQVGKRG